jgi:ABC-type antimicrobial peptide transport system permease subunit
VIALLVAFALVALVAAGTMLAAGAHADVQRRLPAFGVQRTLGFTPASLAAAQARESALLAAPAAALGLGAGALAVAGTLGRAARATQPAAAGMGAAARAGRVRAGDHRARHRVRHLARLAGGTPPAGRDPARR